MLSVSNKYKTIRRLLIVTICCMGLLPLLAQAAIYIETKIVSGTISAVRDNAVELDGTGTFYYPASEKMTMTLKLGDNITLKYFIDNSRGEPRRVYVEFAPGMFSLNQSAPPRTVRRTKQ